ncbi:MAG: Gfo/Idh/MocA family oxidoreductase [Deltaproteobacteria bacterium]|nr:Gfo/Idh/MocA family oxidoreductase [Deltaproteobacteria bacterium]
MATDKVNIGLIGLGYWGKNILRNLNELGVLLTACDTDPAIISELGERYPDTSFSLSPDEVINSRDIGAVAIAAPASTHYDLVKESLLAGKDVFVEKPLALTVGEGEELTELAEREGRILMVGHILQYHSAVIKLKGLISKGELGKIQYIYSNRLNIGKLRTEENILWSFAPHDISVILTLLDEEPITVSAFGGGYLNNDICDTTLTTLEFRNGVKGHIFVSWLHPFKEQKLIVVGSKGMAVFDDVSDAKLLLYPHTIEWKEGRIPVAQKADYRTVPVEKGEPLKEELGHFLECIRQRTRPKTDGHEGVRVLRVLDAAEFALGNRPAGEGLTPPSPALPSTVFVHESSSIDPGTTIGEGTKVWLFSHILKGSSIGRDSIIGQNVMIGPDVTVGNRCKIQNNVSLYKGVVLEDEVFCGPSCVFTNVYNPRTFVNRKGEFQKTVVKRGATIGANATIVCGTTVGRYAMIGAGAVVRRDVPDYAVVAGVPAQQIGWACKCGITLRFDNEVATCGCGSQYRAKGDTLTIVEEEV